MNMTVVRVMAWLLIALFVTITVMAYKLDGGDEHGPKDSDQSRAETSKKSRSEKHSKGKD